MADCASPVTTPLLAGALFYMEGFIACSNGHGLFSNPYDLDRYRHTCWQKGWFAALTTLPVAAEQPDRFA